MDPLSAIGLASAVVQFVAFGLTIAKRLDEFNAAHPGDIPRSLQAIGIKLPLLLNALNRIKSDAQINNFDVNTKCILKGVIAGCQAQVREVESMINEISRAPGESFKSKIKKVFTSLKYDEKIFEVERNLHTYISVLILHHVVDSNEAPPQPVDDVFFDVRDEPVTDYAARPALFKELNTQLYNASRSLVQNPTILTLSGSKGVGKTQLALAYCHAVNALGQFKTVFWLDASTLENLQLGLEGMYATIKRATDGSRTSKLAFVKSYMDELWHPWLLVLDNYEPTLLYNEILELLPSRGYGGIILITRNTESSGLGNVVNVPKFVSISNQKQLDTMLQAEVQRQNTEGIRRLVEQGADVNTMVWNEWPILHRCALLGLDEAVALLLERGADPDPNVDFRKALYWACSGGNERICRMLLDHEDQTGRLSTTTNIQSAFDTAAEKPHLEVMRLLATRRVVNFNSKNTYDRTPIQNASQKGNLEVVRFLIDNGALLDKHGQVEIALTEAAAAGHLDIVKILIAEGKVSVNTQDAQGLTPLCHAAGLRDSDYKGTGMEMATFFLEKGADPNLIGSDGPLHKAAVYDLPDMLNLLLSHGADPTLSCEGWTPISRAIKYKSPAALAALIHAPIPDPAARTALLEAALRYACRAGNREAVLELINAGTDINAVEKEGLPKGASPLLLAILGEHIKTAQLLVRRGAKQDLADVDGRLPLSIAAQKGFDGLMRDLLKAGGDINLKSGPNEDTPLIMAAARKENLKTIQFLLDHGADRDLVNKFGDIALDVAEEKGWKEMVELLEA